MSEITAVVTLTVAFGLEAPITEDEIKEHALEWIGSVSDTFLFDGMTVTIEEDE